MGRIDVGGDAFLSEDLVDRGAVVVAETPVDGGDVLGQFVLVAHADEGDGNGGVAQDPGEGELGQGLVVAGGELLESLADAEFLEEVLLFEEGEFEGFAAAAPVPVDEGGFGGEGAAEEAEAEATEGDEEQS